MPQTTNNRTNNNQFDNSDPLQDRITYRECVTATLPFNSNNNQKDSNKQQPPTQQQQQDLVLSKVKIHKSVGDCFKNNLLFTGELESFAKDLICVTELTKNDETRDGGRLNKQDGISNDTNDKTHVLICATNQASRSR